MNLPIAAVWSLTEWKVPRRMAWRVRSWAEVQELARAPTPSPADGRRLTDRAGGG